MVSNIESKEGTVSVNTVPIFLDKDLTKEEL